MAKLTVSVSATMSSRAAAINSPRSSSDSVDSRCSRESGGASDVNSEPTAGMLRLGLPAVSHDSGRIHSLKNADGDLVV